MNVSPVDWLIFATLFAALLAMAIWINAQCKSVADYLVSGRKVRLWLGMGAGIAGEVGLVSIVSICEQGYMRGFGFILLALLSMLVTLPLFGIFGFGIERFRATRAMSVPQYVEMRYSRRLRILTGMQNSLAGVLQMCIFPIVGAQFVRTLTDAPEQVTLASITIPTAWIIMLVLLCCSVIFTYLGGFVTLIVTNFFQMIVIMVVIYWLFFYLAADIGFQELWTNLEQSKGLAGFYPFADEADSYGFIWFAWLMTMTILLQFSYGPYLQKMASMDRPKTVSKSFLIGSLFSNGRTFVILGLGVCALAVLGESPPDAVNVSSEVWSKMATPYYLAQVVPPVMMGFLLAGLLFADISTTDQYLLSWSTSIVNDCIVPFRKTPFSSRVHIRAVRLTIACLCVLFFVFGMFYTPTLPLWEYLWLCANVIGGSGIAVVFGMYWRRASTAGAYAAILTCSILPIVDLVARQVHAGSGSQEPFPLSPQTTGFGTYMIGIGLLVIISLMSRKPTAYWDLGSDVRQQNEAGQS
ncbi:hypothetical protein OAS39_05290 [Pirellulales bacterium]|nr:hypothetical protein [Pirellulales bacterium]